MLKTARKTVRKFVASPFGKMCIWSAVIGIGTGTGVAAGLSTGVLLFGNGWANFALGAWYVKTLGAVKASSEKV